MREATGVLGNQRAGHSSTIVHCARCGKRWKNDGPVVVVLNGEMQTIEDVRRYFWQPDCACRPCDPRTKAI